MPKHFEQRKECPVCRSKDFRELYSLGYGQYEIKSYLNSFYDPQGGVDHAYLEDASYNLLRCKNCKLTFQEYFPNDELMYLLYEKWIDPNIVKQQQEEMPLWYYETYAYQIIEIINYFRVNSNQLKFLDYGMGWGKWCLMAKAFGCNVTGLELSKSRIDYAELNGIDVINDEELTTKQFDYINTDQVFEHLPYPRITLEKLVSCLKPNGLIKLSVPNGNSVDEVIELMDWSLEKGEARSVNLVAPLEHLNCFTSDSLRTLASEMGLSEVILPRTRFQYRSKKDFIKKTIKGLINKKNSETSSFFIKN